MAITLDGTVGVTSPDFIPSSSNIPTNGLFLPAANALGFATNSTERLRLDASGNLGLGVTPSGWQSTWVALQVGPGISIGTLKSNSGNQALEIGSNYYVNSGYKYQASSTATRYEQDGGIHSWYNAPSGTAGTAINFTQAMTLDASGNLGVGLTANANTRIDASGPIRAQGYTVATLPTGVIGARAYVTDAVTAVFQAVPTGGGSVKTPVFYNGSNWVCG